MELEKALEIVKSNPFVPACVPVEVATAYSTLCDAIADGDVGVINDEPCCWYWMGYTDAKGREKALWIHCPPSMAESIQYQTEYTGGIYLNAEAGMPYLTEEDIITTRTLIDAELVVPDWLRIAKSRKWKNPIHELYYRIKSRKWRKERSIDRKWEARGCQKCEHFEIVQEPIDGPGCWFCDGKAVCHKYNLQKTFYNEHSFDNLRCPEDRPRK